MIEFRYFKLGIALWGYGSKDTVPLNA